MSRDGVQEAADRGDTSAKRLHSPNDLRPNDVRSAGLRNGGPDAFRRHLKTRLRLAGRRTLQLLLAPFRGYLSLRNSMTYASVFALLGIFLTLNVIWGFPWSGMMGLFLAILLIGFAINRAMSPKLKLSVTLPRVAIAGEPFSLSVRLTNPRYFPAINLRVGFHREGLRLINRALILRQWDASPPVSVQILRSGGQIQWHGSMRFDTRGIHQLPPFRVSSSFPFHLYHSRTEIPCQTQIAITPVPANPNDDPTSRLMLAEIGDWTQQLVAGAPVEYIGNREYQVGVPVRRWDFASWARLGRPIVREYQSPSIQSVTLIVDTSQPPAQSRHASAGELNAHAQQFERLMSIATTAINEITSRRVQLALHVTDQPDPDGFHGNRSAIEPSDSMLVRLAAAEPIEPRRAEKEIIEVLEASRRQPVLILSLIDLNSPERSELASQLPSSAKYLQIETMPEQNADTSNAKLKS